MPARVDRNAARNSLHPIRKLAGGAVAQLGERCVRNAEVRGSTPLGSTRPTGIPPPSLGGPNPRKMTCRHALSDSIHPGSIPLQEDPTMRKTPLHALHRKLDARMVPFAGYELPVQYPDGIKAEHLHVRAQAGLFDVSHMGQVSLRGAGAADLLRRLCPLDPERMAEGRCHYTLLLAPNAGILDDLIVTRLGKDRFLAVCNATRIDTDLAHIRRHAKETDVQVEPLERALLAVQGPEAGRILAAAIPEAATLAPMCALELPGDRLLCRSGYTGEDGYEIALPPAEAESFAESLLADPALAPIGLGARDSLRLEAGLCLYGQDLTEDTTPVEAGLMWTIDRQALADGSFVGAEALRAAAAEKPARRRVGLRPTGRMPVRAGAQLSTPDGTAIGQVTSGGYGPSLDAPVAMGYVGSCHADPGTVIHAEVRKSFLPCEITKLPFVPHRRPRKENR